MAQRLTHVNFKDIVLIIMHLSPDSAEKGEEQNREEGEMAPKKLGGGRNRGKK